ncbi:MAG: PBP1A family penicillin-binding protein [Clostridia bacterium]
MAKKKSGKAARWIKGLILTCTLAVLAFVLFFAVHILRLDAWHQFDPAKILDTQQTLIIYDGNGTETVRLHGAEDRVMIELKEMPYLARMAFISAEDARFYDHIGIDFIRIAGAAWEDIKAGGYVQGASTISQQLIKLSHLTAEKTMTRKLEEAVLAYQMEQQFSKDEILGMYLNYVYFGGGYYGIEAASRGYFGINASELSVAQAAMLAGILKSPARYSPHIDYEASIERRNNILRLMQEYGYITKDQMDAASEEKPIIVHNMNGEIKRGYYVDTVMRDAMTLLNVDAKELLAGGYRIYTCMDAEVQARCEAIFAAPEFFPADNTQAAMVVQRAGSGEIIALLGGRNNDTAMAFNRATDIRRQPGSVIKPIICYAPALDEHGYTAATVLLDEPTTFGDYSPSNYGSKYYGYVTLRQAVTKSLNIPAVKVLSDIGVRDGKEFAQQCGIQFNEMDTSLTLALGGFTYGVSPWQLAGAYGVFASNGIYNTPTVIRSITDATGKVLYQYVPEESRVMSEQNAYILTSMLESVISEGTGHRLNGLKIPLAGKTGTVGDENGNRDAWMATYNPEYIAVVWMGYDDNRVEYLPADATGGNYPAQMLGELYGGIYPDADAPGFVMPDGVVEYKLDDYTMKTQHNVVLASALTPQRSVYKEIFKVGSEPSCESDYWVVPSKPRDFNVFLDGDGQPHITFTPVQGFAEYVLYRNDSIGETKVIKKWGGSTGKVEYIDTTAQYGETYTYYVVPMHPELYINHKQVAGPATTKKNVSLPSKPMPINEEQQIDFTMDR